MYDTVLLRKSYVEANLCTDLAALMFGIRHDSKPRSSFIGNILLTMVSSATHSLSLYRATELQGTCRLLCVSVKQLNPAIAPRFSLSTPINTPYIQRHWKRDQLQKQLRPYSQNLGSQVSEVPCRTRYDAEFKRISGTIANIRLCKASSHAKAQNCYTSNYMQSFTLKLRASRHSLEASRGRGVFLKEFIRQSH